ncbi:MAG: MFS transporter [Acidimicrobiales bacterium]
MGVLRVPGFRLLLAGQAVNAVGNWVALIAIWGLAAFRFDAGAGDLALLFVVLALPGALFGPLLGVPIDRLGPRRTLIVSNALGFASALALTQATSYRAIIALALPLGLIESLGAASLDALPPRMVDDSDLVRANALLGGADDLAVIVGPLVAAGVNLRWGLAGAFLVDALSFLVGLAVALRIRVGAEPVAAAPPRAASAGLAGAGPAPIPDKAPPAEGSTWRDLREGLGIARRQRGVRWTLAVAASTYLLWSLFGVLEPLYVRDVLGQSDTMFALLQAVFGVGLVSAGLVIAAIGDRVATPANVAVATILSGLAAALYLGTRSLAVAFVGVFVWGVGVAFFYVPVKTLLQRYTPASAHGRILSLNQTLEAGAEIVMTPLAAVALAVVGVQTLGLVGGAVIAVAGVLALRGARRLRAQRWTSG